MRMRIRILAGKLDSGAGSHVYNRQLAMRLAARGHDVSVVAFARPPQANCPLDVIEIPPGDGTAPRLLWRFEHLRRYRRCHAGVLRAPLAECDVVVGAEHLLMKAHRRRFPHTPLVYLPHALSTEQELRSYRHGFVQERVGIWLYKHLQRWALREAEATIRFTRHACDVLRSEYGSSVRTRFAVIPMGVDVPESQKAPMAGGAVRFIWVGQLIDRKRLDLAIRALAGMRQREWRFDIVGVGDQRPVLETLVRDLGLTDRIRFHGFSNEVWRHFREADLMLFPSWLENSPVAMLEAMSFGVPCLAMRHDGVRYFNANAEIMTDGVDGFLAASDEDFTRMLAGLLESPHRIAGAGIEARRTIERTHTWDRHLDRCEALFTDVLAAGAPDARIARLSRA